MYSCPGMRSNLLGGSAESERALTLTSPGNTKLGSSRPRQHNGITACRGLTMNCETGL